MEELVLKLKARRNFLKQRLYYFTKLVHSSWKQQVTVCCLRFSNMARLRPTLLKKRLWHKCFPVNFAKFLRTPFFMEHFQWLLLNNVPFDITDILPLN